ncbi:MAG: membrane protein insertase YidC [Candidatus Cloacimonetes bacterium]|nr:membrane protein insertase YidC [Candidatus Cloacimonadota bacterium]
MDKRTLLAIFLILIVFLISQKFLWKTPEVTQTVRNEKPVENQHKQSEAESLQENEEILSEVKGSDIPVNNQIILQNEKMMITFSNKGGIINSIMMKDYKMPDGESEVELIPDNSYLADVNLETTSGQYPLTNLIFDYEIMSEPFPGVRFFIENEGISVLEKRFVLNNDYNLDFTLSTSGFRESVGYSLSFESGINDTEENLKYKDQDYQIVLQIDNEVKTSKLSVIRKKQPVSKGKIDWAVIRSKYFLFAVIPEKRINLEEVRQSIQKESPAMNLYVKNDIGRNTFEDNFSFYLGPDIDENLVSYGAGLENIIRVWKPLRAISRYFLKFMQLIYRFVPNYGFAIVIFALIFKLILTPLNHKMQVSGHKLQMIQPKVKELQKKYRNDTRTMNIEIQKLYKEEGVNPLGGCLPMLLQMPIFFAIYPVFRYNIALRQSGFVFWINDLSAPDRLYILPILMGLFMIVQQKMMAPLPMDPDKMDEKQKAAQQSQKLMMYFMPVFMVYIFISLPSGLVLYWTIFNVLSIIHQYFLKKRMQVKTLS